MRRFFVGMMIGLGAGMMLSGTFAIVSPFREPVTNMGVLGLGMGLLIGGVVAAVLARSEKDKGAT